MSNRDGLCFLMVVMAQLLAIVLIVIGDMPVTLIALLIIFLVPASFLLREPSWLALNDKYRGNL